MSKWLKSQTLSIKSMTLIEKVWLAGFIDGEGYIGITKQKKLASKKMPKDSYTTPT